jgi:hypothetical protein
MGVFDLLPERATGSDPTFDIEVNYTHGETGLNLTEGFHFEPGDLRGTLIKESDVEKQGSRISRELHELSLAVGKLSDRMEKFSSIAAPTGLQFSVTALKNLRHIMFRRTEIEMIAAQNCGYEVFQEVLGVNLSLAYRLYEHFRRERTKKLEEIEGMTPELIKEFHKHFVE